jgi:hypothetical protein
MKYNVIQQNIKFFNTGTFLSQLLYAFDTSQFRELRRPIRL